MLHVRALIWTDSDALKVSRLDTVFGQRRFHSRFVAHFPWIYHYTILIKQTQPDNADLIWPSNRSKFNFYILASFVCNNLDNTVRRDYHNRCKKWKNAWGDKPECCTKCQSNWRTCYDECNEEIDLAPPGNLLFLPDT